MTRHTTTPCPAPAARRVTGTPAVAAIALAAACVLAACGPDDPTDQVAAAPMEITKTTTTVTTTSRPITAATVIPAQQAPVAVQAAPQLVQVADRSERVAQAPRATYGQISAIEPITQTPKTSGTGAVVGGVLGAVLGNQVGSGGGRAAATVLGGVGGAVVGNKVEKHRGETVVGYRVHVQLDNGSSRSFERTNLGGLDVGDRVRVDGGRLREV